MLDVITGADIVATGWKTPPVLSFFKGVGGSSVRIPFRPALAHERVRFVGEPVAVVVAETEHLAQDAAETHRDRIRGPAGRGGCERGAEGVGAPACTRRCPTT